MNSALVRGSHFKKLDKCPDSLAALSLLAEKVYGRGDYELKYVNEHGFLTNLHNDQDLHQAKALLKTQKLRSFFVVVTDEQEFIDLSDSDECSEDEGCLASIFPERSLLNSYIWLGEELRMTVLSANNRVIEEVPGVLVEVTWQLANTGTSPWPDKCCLVPDSSQSQQIFLPRLPPGGVVTISTTVQMPSVPKALKLRWVLFSPTNHSFGEELTVALVPKWLLEFQTLLDMGFTTKEAAAALQTASGNVLLALSSFLKEEVSL